MKKSIQLPIIMALTLVSGTSGASAVCNAYVHKGELLEQRIIRIIDQKCANGSSISQKCGNMVSNWSGSFSEWASDWSQSSCIRQVQSSGVVERITNKVTAHQSWMGDLKDEGYL